MILSDVSINRPVFATMMMAALVTLGLFSFRRLSIDEWPDISFPFIAVQTEYPGASPETVERDLTRKIEEAVNPIDGVRTLTSTSSEGFSSIFVEFELGTDPAVAQQDVRAKIEAIRGELPSQIEQPLVQRFDPEELPIVSLALRSDVRSPRELSQIADLELRRELEGVDGVGQVTLIGTEKRAIVVELDPERLAAQAVPMEQVLATLAAENLEMPAGRLEFGPQETLVRVAGRLASPADFAGLVVALRDGVPIRLSDLGTVRDDAEEPRSAAMVNGVPAIGFDMRKVSGANTVEVAESIKEKVEELQARLPAGVTLSVVRDNSIWIKNSVEDVQTTILLGAALTVLVVFTFLNSWRSTVITGLTLPVSIIAACIALFAFGFTLNTMTLMALSLATGILIDDAIVVRENIVRNLSLGLDHRLAARRGTSEIGLAVLATTCSTLSVFIPVGFMGGIVGQFFKEFGITVAFAVAVSLFVSFTLDPMLSSVWYDPVAAGHAPHGPLGRMLERFNDGFVGLGKQYRRLLGWALRHRIKTIGIAVASFIAALLLFPMVGGSFMPEVDSGQFAVVAKAPVGSSLDYTRARMQELSQLVRAHPEVIYTYETIGGGWNAQVNEAEFYVKLTPKEERKISETELMALLRRELGTLPGLQVSLLQAGGFGGAMKPLQIYVQGEQLDELRRISDEVLDVVRKVPGAIEAESGLEAERPEIRVELRRELASNLGLGVQSVAGALQPAFGSRTVSTWQDPTGEQHDVLVRFPRTDRETREQLERMPIAGGGRDESGAPNIVRLGHIADLETGTSAQKIERRNLQRVVLIQANYEVRPLTEISADIERGVRALDLPPGYTVRLGGETQDFRETVEHIIESMVLAVIFIYLVLASQFGSFLQPLAIMLALPLSLVGVLIALLVTGSTFNIMSMIGLILLMGLVTKNAILLVDFANQARRRGVSRHDALIDAGEIRLRPIVMTTLAMIFGMMPLALAIGSGAEFRAPMARAVIGGLITSSLLTLVVVPVVYTFFDGFGASVQRRLTAREKRRHAEEAQADTESASA